MKQLLSTKESILEAKRYLASKGVFADKLKTFSTNSMGIFEWRDKYVTMKKENIRRAFCFLHP